MIALLLYGLAVAVACFFLGFLLSSWLSSGSSEDAYLSGKRDSSPVEYGPDDQLVFTTSKQLRREDVERIREQWDKWAVGKPGPIVLNGLDLVAVRRLPRTRGSE